MDVEVIIIAETASGKIEIDYHRLGEICTTRENVAVKLMSETTLMDPSRTASVPGELSGTITKIYRVTYD